MKECSGMAPKKSFKAETIADLRMVEFLKQSEEMNKRTKPSQ